MSLTPYSRFEDLAEDLYDLDDPIEKDGMSLPRLRYDEKEPIDSPVLVHDNIEFGFVPTARGGAAIGFSSYRTIMPSAQLISLQGYMQGPAVGITDKAIKPLLPFLHEQDVVGLSYAHGNRGTSNVLTRQGRYTVGDIQEDVAADLRQFNTQVTPDRSKNLPVVLMGHSQGGQHVAHILANPEKYGLTRDRIRGVVLMNSMLLPHSQPMIMTPGFAWDIARKSLGQVAWSMVRPSGRGLLFRGQQAFDAFVGEGSPEGVNERRVTDFSFPDSGLFFTQTITTGTSPSLKDANLKGLPVAVISSNDDQLMSQELQHKTAEYLESLGADVHVHDIPGKHFSPIVTVTEEPQDRAEHIMRENGRAYQHAFRNI
ncbi:MAG: alpha/beta fold hydrolase [Candidatus Gracilibacteria bacterium]